MNRIRLAAAAVNQTPMAWHTNSRHIRAAIDAARNAGVNVLCLPELCVTGYGCEDMFFSTGVQRTAFEVLLELVSHTRSFSPVSDFRLSMRARSTTQSRLLRTVDFWASWPNSIWQAMVFITSHAGSDDGRKGSWAASKSKAKLSDRRSAFRLRRRPHRL